MSPLCVARVPRLSAEFSFLFACVSFLIWGMSIRTVFALKMTIRETRFCFLHLKSANERRRRARVTVKWTRYGSPTRALPRRAMSPRSAHAARNTEAFADASALIIYSTAHCSCPRRSPRVPIRRVTRDLTLGYESTLCSPSAAPVRRV